MRVVPAPEDTRILLTFDLNEAAVMARGNILKLDSASKNCKKTLFEICICFFPKAVIPRNTDYGIEVCL
jgi:hypothetical protein